MANLSATYALPLIEQYSGTLDKYEYRRSNYGALETFQRDSNGAGAIFSSRVKEYIRNSWGNTVKVPVINHDSTITIGNTRSCTISPDENTSALVTLTFGTMSWGFSMVPDQYENNNNFITYEEDWRVKFNKYVLAVLDQLDTLAYTKANTARNTVWNADTEAQYDTTGDALQVPPSEWHDFYNYAPSIFQSMDFLNPNYNVIASTFHAPVVNRLSAQGAGNSVNEAFQFGQFNWALSNRVPNDTDVKSTIILSAPGTYAFETRIDSMGRRGATTTDGTEWGSMIVPGLGIEVSTLFKSTCADNSAVQGSTTAHLTGTPIEYYGYSFDYCFATAYNSDPTTRYNPIVKAEFLKAEPA